MFAAGNFGTAGGVAALRIARWNNISWSPVDGGMNLDVLTLLADPGTNGRAELYAGGFFSSAGGQVSSGIALANCPVPRCKADMDGDGMIDFNDYLFFVSVFVEGSELADYNEDASIDFFDYLDFADGFSSGC